MHFLADNAETQTTALIGAIAALFTALGVLATALIGVINHRKVTAVKADTAEIKNGLTHGKGATDDTTSDTAGSSHSG